MAVSGIPHPQGGWSAAVFYLLGDPTPCAYEILPKMDYFWLPSSRSGRKSGEPALLFYLENWIRTLNRYVTKFNSGDIRPSVLLKLGNRLE
jgi:hypothetical protein